MQLEAGSLRNCHDYAETRSIPLSLHSPRAGADGEDTDRHWLVIVQIQYFSKGVHNLRCVAFLKERLL